MVRQRAVVFSRQVPVSRNNVPVAKNFVVRGGKPRMRAMGDGLSITHRELIASEPGSTTWGIDISQSVNPALPGVANTTQPTLFPWLQAQAKGFEEYQFTRLAFHYIPSVSTSTSGLAMMSFDYDPSDNTPTSEADMMANYGAVCGAIWNELRLVVDLSRVRGDKRKFNRITGKTGSLSPFDYGIFNFAVAGNPSSAVVGRVWV